MRPLALWLSRGTLYASAGISLGHSVRDLWLSGSLEVHFTHLQDIFSSNRTTLHSIASLREKTLFGRGPETGRGVKVSRGRICSSWLLSGTSAASGSGHIDNSLWLGPLALARALALAR